MEQKNLLFEEESYKIIGVCMKVHRNLGAGFLESVYQEAMEKEFSKEVIQCGRQVKLQLFYDGQPMKKFFIADFVCFNKVLLEIKASLFLHKEAEARTINYLKSTGLPVGLLVNFGHKSLIWKRFINTPDYKG